MNYIAISNRYWQLHRQEGFQPGESHLYWCILNLFSSKGKREVWPESLRFTDGALSAEAGVNIKTIDKTRKSLQDRGLIWVESKGQGAREGRTYWLADETGTYPQTCPKNGEVTPPTSPTTYPKNGEVNGEVEDSLTQQLTQQLTQKHTQNLDKSLYIVRIETGNSETETLSQEKKEGKHFLSDASGNDPDAEKKDPNPQFRPPPSPDSADSSDWPAKVKTDRVFGETAHRNLKLDGDRLNELIDEFSGEQAALEQVHATFRDFKKHCYNWLRIQSEKSQRNGTAKNTKPVDEFGQGAVLPQGAVYRPQRFGGRRHQPGDGVSG